MERQQVGRWSQHTQSPEGEVGERFAFWRDYWRRRGYRFLHVHIYQVAGWWWIDLEMERI